MFLLDTNVLSELRKVRSGKADSRVAAWLRGASVGNLFLSVIVIQELEIGVLLAERRDRAKGALLRSWLDDHVLPVFADRILPVDTAVARRSASLHVPDPRPIRDGLIAATALVHGMVVVTRNVADFEPTGVRTLDPWSAAGVSLDAAKAGMASGLQGRPCGCGAPHCARPRGRYSLRTRVAYPPRPSSPSAICSASSICRARRSWRCSIFRTKR